MTHRDGLGGSRRCRRCGLGFHLHDPGQQLTYTVISNWTDGAWPVVALLNDQMEL